MKAVVTVLILALLSWQGWQKYQQLSAPAPAPLALSASDIPDERPETRPDRPGGTPFRCDGRTRCSQMTSCEEATWFLKNCPGTQMDGNNDGIPCERQWCK